MGKNSLCRNSIQFIAPQNYTVNSTLIRPATDGDEQFKGDLSDYDEEILDEHQDSGSVEEMKPYYSNETTSGTRFMLHEPDANTTQSYAELSADILVENPAQSVDEHNQDIESDNFTVLSSPGPTRISTPIAPKVIARQSHIQLATVHNSQYQQQQQHFHQPLSVGGSAPMSSHQSDSIVSGGGSVNYFLMDVQQQMDKLNDIAQIELKIEIQKLLLDKLRCANNLRLSDL